MLHYKRLLETFIVIEMIVTVKLAMPPTHLICLLKVSEEEISASLTTKT